MICTHVLKIAAGGSPLGNMTLEGRVTGSRNASEWQQRVDLRRLGPEKAVGWSGSTAAAGVLSPATSGLR